VHIQPDAPAIPVHSRFSLRRRRHLIGSGGRSDTYGSARAAQAGRSQGRPPTNTGSQSAVQHRLPTLLHSRPPCPGRSHRMPDNPAPPSHRGPGRAGGAETAAGGGAAERPGAQGADPNDKDPPDPGANQGKPKEREALGRSRGGLTTKVRLLADSGCRPLARLNSAGQRHDSVAFIPLMGRLKVARRGRGRPRTRPARVLADKAYSSGAIRSHLRRRGIRATISEPADQIRGRLRRGTKGGRPPAFDPPASQAAQHRRTRLQQAPPAPRRRQPVRQARLRLPRNSRRRSDPDLAPRPHTTRFTGHALVRRRSRTQAGSSRCRDSSGPLARPHLTAHTRRLWTRSGLGTTGNPSAGVIGTSLGRKFTLGSHG